MRLLLAALLVLMAMADVVTSGGPSAGLESAAEADLLPEQVRRQATPVYPLDHELLARRPDNSPHDPEQVHVTLAGPGGAAISWTTHPQLDSAFMADLRTRQNSASDEEVEAWLEDELAKKHHHKKRSRNTCKDLMLAPLTAQVTYGTASGNYQYAVNGTFTCYSSYDYASGALHHVLIGAGQEGPLEPNTTYYYRVGDPGQQQYHSGGVFSTEYSFRTPLATGGDGFPLRVALIGDLGQTEDSRATLEHAAANSPDLVVNVGDLSYADGFQPRWDSYGRLVEPFTATLPWMVVEGNHEKELIDGDKTFLAYESRYYLPHRESGSPDPLYYSFETGGVHFVMLGSYADVAKGSDQHAWLVDDLSKMDRSRTPWLVVAMHVPWYNSNTAHYGEGDEAQASMERTLYEHGADLVFSGHVHAYERFHRVFHNRHNDCGPAHINIGDGGNWEGLDTKYLHQPKWSAYREPTFGHGMLLVHNATHATWEWHRNTDKVARVGDRVTFVRSLTCNSNNSGSGGGSSSDGKSSGSVAES